MCILQDMRVRSSVIVYKLPQGLYLIPFYRETCKFSEHMMISENFNSFTCFGLVEQVFCLNLKCLFRNFSGLFMYIWLASFLPIQNTFGCKCFVLFLSRISSKPLPMTVMYLILTVLFSRLLHRHLNLC